MTLTNRYLAALRASVETRAGEAFCHQRSAAGERTITWGGLGEDMGRFAAAYRGLDRTAGDQILIFLRHAPDLYGAFFGAMAAGLAPAFMPCASPRQDPRLYWGSHRELIAGIRPLAIVTSRDVLAEMQAAGLGLDDVAVLIAEELAPAPLVFDDAPEDAIGLLQHSSGTTGLKKGVALSYRAILAQAESYGAAIGLGADDVVVSWLPLYHDMGLIACMILPAFHGVTTVHLDPFWWVGRPGSLFDAIAAHRGTLCWLPNFAFEHLVATAGRRAGDYDLSGMRAFISCSEPVKAATFDRFLAAFGSSGVTAGALQSCYAMAETVFAVTQTPSGEAPRRLVVNPASLDRGRVPVRAADGVELVESGRVVEGLSVSVVDEARRPLPENAVGEIAISGAFLFSGYNRNPEATARRLADGVYYSRDIGFIHDGGLYVLGRTDDQIIVNGRNLYAHEVEASLHGLGWLKPGRAVAIGVFDRRVGSQTLVVLAEKRSDAAIADAEARREISDRISSIFEVAPRAVEVLDEGRLIKTTSGKISRSENLKRYQAARDGETRHDQG